MPPQDLGAAAKQSWWQGERGALATPAAPDGLLGASVAPSASQGAWEKASGVLASAAQGVEADEAPPTVKTAGGQAPQGAGQALGPQRTGRWGCLQACLPIRARATQTLGDAVAQGPKRVGEA